MYPLNALTALTFLALGNHYALSAEEVVATLCALPALRYAVLVGQPRLGRALLTRVLDEAPCLELLETDWAPHDAEDWQLAERERLRLRHSVSKGSSPGCAAAPSALAARAALAEWRSV